MPAFVWARAISCCPTSITNTRQKRPLGFHHQRPSCFQSAFCPVTGQGRYTRRALLGLVSRIGIQLTIILRTDFIEQANLGFKKINMALFIQDQFLKQMH